MYLRGKRIAAVCIASMMMCLVAACGKTSTDTQGTTNSSAESTKADESKQDNENDNSTKKAEIDESKDDAFILKHYKEILDLHYQALSEKWAGEALLDSDLSLMLKNCYENEPLKNVFYALVDINNDGNPELFITPATGDNYDDKVIYEMYTVSNNETKQIFASDERDRYYLSKTEEGAYIITSQGSSSATEGIWNYYTLEGDGFNLVQGVRLDASTDNSEELWSLAYPEDGTDNTTVDQKTAWDIIHSYESTRIIPGTHTLSEYK